MCSRFWEKGCKSHECAHAPARAVHAVTMQPIRKLQCQQVFSFHLSRLGQVNQGMWARDEGSVCLSSTETNRMSLNIWILTTCRWAQQSGIVLFFSPPPGRGLQFEVLLVPSPEPTMGGCSVKRHLAAYCRGGWGLLNQALTMELRGRGRGDGCSEAGSRNGGSEWGREGQKGEQGRGRLQALVRCCRIDGGTGDVVLLCYVVAGSRWLTLNVKPTEGGREMRGEEAEMETIRKKTRLVCVVDIWTGTMCSIIPPPLLWQSMNRLMQTYNISYRTQPKDFFAPQNKDYSNWATMERY